MGILASLGIGFITDMVKSHGEDLVRNGIEKVTGIKMDKKPTEEEKRTIVSKIGAIRTTVKLLKDKQDARKMAAEMAANGKDWLLRNTGSIIALLVVVGVFVLFGLLLSGSLSIENSSVAMIAGFAGGYVTQILSFYYGSSKESADFNRK